MTYMINDLSISFTSQQQSFLRTGGKELTSPLSSFIPIIGSGLFGCSSFALFAFRPKSLSVVAPLIVESAVPEFRCFSALPFATPSTSGSVMSFFAARLTAWSSVEEPFHSWNLWPLTVEERLERGSEVDCCCCCCWF